MDQFSSILDAAVDLKTKMQDLYEYMLKQEKKNREKEEELTKRLSNVEGREKAIVGKEASIRTMDEINLKFEQLENLKSDVENAKRIWDKEEGERKNAIKQKEDELKEIEGNLEKAVLSLEQDRLNYKKEILQALGGAK